MSSVDTALVVLAKEPVPGRVKTRLHPPFSYRQAAALAEAALTDTLATVAATRARRRILALDGAPGPWLPPGFEVVSQVDGGLDRRIAAALAATGDGPALLVGMDTPQLTADLLATRWGGTGAVLGLAEDGGYWCIGLRDPALAASVLHGVPMSTSDTGARQLERLHAAGLRVRLLPVLRDVDTAADARAVAAAAPGSAFARTFGGLAPVLA
jgi:glycosyltransferase A (GT-A) superfamily protein (DUF2064 family)